MLHNVDVIRKLALISACENRLFLSLKLHLANEVSQYPEWYN